MFGKDKPMPSPIFNASTSLSRSAHFSERTREFDRKVMALTKDFNELCVPGKNAIQKVDIAHFFEKSGLYDAHKVDLISEKMDDNKDDLITK